MVLTEDELTLLYLYLRQACKQGYGEITIRVYNGKIDTMHFTPSVKMTDSNQVRAEIDRLTKTS